MRKRIAAFCLTFPESDTAFGFAKHLTYSDMASDFARSGPRIVFSRASTNLRQEKLEDMSPYKTNARILLVEDDPVVALLELRSLRENGYTVEHASSGRAAIEFVHPTGDSFDLILMDIDLGADMDGVEAARQILERGDIPILFHSSHTDPEVIARTEEVTSYGYVVKNTGMIVLDTSIKMALRLAHSRKQQKEHELALQVSERELRQA